MAKAEIIDTIAPTQRCEVCEYDLRGLPENRCPECRAPFDPHARPVKTVIIPSPAEAAGGMIIATGGLWAFLVWLYWLSPSSGWRSRIGMEYLLFLLPAYLLVAAVPGRGVFGRCFIFLATCQMVLSGGHGGPTGLELFFVPGLALAIASAAQNSQWKRETRLRFRDDWDSGRWVWGWYRGCALLIVVIVFVALWTARNMRYGPAGVPHWPIALLICAAIVGLRRPRGPIEFNDGETFWVAFCMISVAAAVIWLATPMYV